MKAVAIGSRAAPEPHPRYEYSQWIDIPESAVTEAVTDIVQGTYWSSTISELDRLDALLELARCTNSFGFSGGDEALWGLTARAKGILRPVAQHLVESPALEGWWGPIDRTDQRLLVWDGDEQEGVEDEVHKWMAHERAENEEGRKRRRPKPGVRVGAEWWSAPTFAMNTWTTGAWSDVPTIVLAHFIDTYTPFEATTATVWSLEIPRTARVYEVQRPEDWRTLVERFPRDVTGTHDGEWRDWGGVDGPWFLPDWEQMMDTYDGVHVSVGGYLGSCGLALAVPGGFTMLTGWIPDAAVWLHDVATSRRILGTWSGHPQRVSDWDSIADGWGPI